MANWEKSTTVLHDPTKRKKINCRDCVHCDEEGCCNKTANVIDSYNTDIWKNCEYFELSEDAYNFEEKDKQFENWRENRKKSRKGTKGYKKAKKNKSDQKIKYDWMNSQPYPSSASIGIHTVKKPKAIAPK
ncbi:MAG: hypothetical protein IKP31_04795 [Lachnospiraceae bacterium]|nr:hypothetical protein [Lachnospiraceae bacterium]